MVGALWTGVSGLAAQQKALDNESNNIANVNTIGYKSSRISFADQFYQNKIGKGAKVLDAEKIFTSGTFKNTGVSYDMALQGSGFFIVADKRQGGAAEEMYTRAGNFRTGDNGKLQDAAGNEVQGWAMLPVDQDKDVLSTNPNTNIFTKAYNKTLSSQIIKHATYVESIAAKATDYNETVKADTIVFSGAGMKSAKAKRADVEAAQKDYTKWLEKLRAEPDGPSAQSIAQVSAINFKTKKVESVASKEGDLIYVTINGVKKSQAFVVTTASAETKTALYAITNIRTDYNLADPATIAAMPAAQQAVENAKYDLLAGRIETYKKLADKISDEIPGLVAYTVSETGGANDDVLEDADVFKQSTKISDMVKGIIQIRSLIPGQEFKISDVGETGGTGNGTTVKGNILTSTAAKEGQGTGALESAREALAKVLTGKQQDVYTNTDLDFSGGAVNFTYGINIYDKDLKKNIPVPNDNGLPLQLVPITITGATSIDDFITKFNTAAATQTPKLTDHVEAVNINGNLVIRTLNKNVDVEFSGTLKRAGIPLDTNSNYSGRAGAGAEFLEVRTKVDQAATKDSLQLRLDYLKISDNGAGEFSVDNTGLITMKQGDVKIAVGQVAIATFSNYRGLQATGDNLFRKTTESGEPVTNLNNDRTAEIIGKNLELSTADLSESLVNLMVFQRAFEANAKTITTSDQLLNTLINLKR